MIEDFLPKDSDSDEDDDDEPVVCGKKTIVSDEELSSGDEAEAESTVQLEPYQLDADQARVALGQIRQKQANASSSLLLQIKLHRAPVLPGDNQYRDVIPLPHAIYADPMRVCLVVKDGETAEDWRPHCDAVLSLSEYRRETKGAVKRRKIIQRFDLFLADGRIAQSMRTQFGFVQSRFFVLNFKIIIQQGSLPL